MKKLLALVPVLVLLAAACSNTTQTAVNNQTPVSNEQVQANTQAQAPTQSSQPTASPEADWKTYTSSSYKFSFRYPASYQVASVKDPNPKVKTIVALKHTGTQGYVYVNTDDKAFSVSRIVQDFPVNTGLDAATKLTFGTNTWYEYSGGGGGVKYSDNFYFNLNGKLIQVIFDGPYASDNNHVTAEIKDIEAKMLASFTVQQTVALKRVCPDAWYDNQMPGVAGQETSSSQYLIVNGKRAELKDYDMDWIVINCKVNKPQPVY